MLLVDFCQFSIVKIYLIKGGSGVKSRVLIIKMLAECELDNHGGCKKYNHHYDSGVIISFDVQCHNIVICL